jgi:hypothetical protein
MFADVYLGTLESFDPYDRTHFDTGHSPRHITGFWCTRDQSLYWEIVSKTGGEWEGVQTDWGCWVAFVTKEGALELFDAHCPMGPEGTLPATSIAIVENRSIRDIIELLPSDRTYLLVAVESG